MCKFCLVPASSTFVFVHSFLVSCVSHGMFSRSLASAHYRVSPTDCVYVRAMFSTGEGGGDAEDGGAGAEADSFWTR